MMTPVACLSEERIMRYLEGGLTEAERPDVDAHVDACEECHAVVAAAGGGEAQGGELEAPLLNGDVIRQFVILGWLGRGGMGVVYDAYDRVLDRRVALKIMRPEAQRRDALLHEAKLAAKVSSPHAVVVYQADLEGDQVFVAMERVDGPTLREYPTRASDQELRRAILEAAAGLVDIHDADIAHGDFKPENVLVGARGAKITDFGLARATGQKNQPSGTPRYTAPEQPRTGASRAADQFAFAVMAWELLTGRHPYLAKGESGPLSPETPSRAICDEGAERIPARLRAALTRALAFEPGDRFASMRALLDAASEERSPRMRGYALLASLVVLGLSVFALLRVTPSNPCQHLDMRLSTIWGEARKAKLGEATRALQAPHVDAIWHYAAQQLDGLAGEWRKEREDVCVATAVRKELSPTTAEARSACLDEVLSDWDAQLTLVAGASAQELAELPSVLSQLPRPAQCRKALAAEEVTPQRLQLYEVRALRRAWRVRDTLDASKRLQSSLDGTRAPGLTAEALALEGWALTRSGSTVAVEKLLEALSAAERARDDGLRASILVDLVFAYQQRGDDAELPILEGVARSALERAQATPALVSELDRSLGRAASRRGFHRRALNHFQRALKALGLGYDSGDILAIPVRLGVAVELGSLGEWPELVRQTDGIQRELATQYPGHPLSVPAAINLSHGYLNLKRFADARDTVSHALEGEGARRAPDAGLGLLHANRALAYVGLREPVLAAQDIARARAIFQQSGSDKGEREATTWIAQVELDLSAGRGANAVEAAERAEALLASGKSKDGARHMSARVALAEACEARRANGDLARALAIADEALAFYERLGDEGNPEELARTRFLVARLLPATQRDRARKLAAAAGAFYLSRPWRAEEAGRVATLGGAH